MKLKKLLNQPEGRRLEFKEKFPKKSDLCKTIIAFANDAGGDIYIGVKDSPREVIGILEDEIFITEEKISNLVFDNCYPLINPDISILNIDNKLVLKVRVYRGSNIPYYLKSKGKTKGTFIRVGSSNRQATDEIIQELERQKRHISFDSEPVFDIKIDLNVDKVKSLYFKATGEELDTISLKKLQLLKPFQDEIRNRVIAPFFKHLGLIDQWGNGLKLIANELKHYEKIELKWFEVGLQFQVQLLNKHRLTDQATDQAEQAAEKAIDQAADQVTNQVKQLLTHLSGEMLSSEIRSSLKLKHNPTFRSNYLIPALKLGLIEMTQPNKPKSPDQKYRLTSKGKEFLIKNW